MSRTMNGINNIEVNEVEFPDGSTITSAQSLVQLDTNNIFTAFNSFVNFPIKTGTTEPELTPTADGQLTTKKYVDEKIADIDTIIDTLAETYIDDATITTLNNVNTLTLSKPDAGVGTIDLILPQTSLSTCVLKTGTQTIDDVKTFSSFPVKSGTTTPTTDGQLATKKYVDDTAGAVPIGDAVLNGANAFSGTNTFNTNRPTSSLTSGVSTTEFITKSDAENRLGNISIPKFSFDNFGSFARMKIKSASSSVTRLYIEPENASHTMSLRYTGTFANPLKLGSAPTLPSNIMLSVRGGMFIDGDAGIRIPRRNLYDSPGLREWWINQNISSGTGTSALNYLYSSNVGTGGAGQFIIKHRLNANGSAQWINSIEGFVNLSDDRLKTNETYLENATESLLKLSVQTYDKEKVNNFSLLERTGKKVRETGVIAQEVYYNAPEFRHLINCGTEYNDEYDLSGNQIGDGNPEGKEIIPDEMDLSGVPIGEDPDYEGAGWSKTEMASVEYQGFIAYLIKSNQELHERILKLENKINNM